MKRFFSSSTLLSLTLILASCSQSHVPIVVDDAHSAVSTQNALLAPSCPSSELFFDPAVNKPVHSEVNGVLLLQDKTILAYGTFTDPATSEKGGYSHKFTTNMKDDARWTYQEGAAVTTQTNGKYVTHTAGALLNGSIPLLAGSRKSASQTYRSGFIRKFKTSNGGLDTTYGTAGFADVTFGTLNGNATDIKDLHVDNQGRTVVLAEFITDDTSKTPTSQIALARLTSTGQLDSTFGTGGKLLVAGSTGKPAVKLVPTTTGYAVLTQANSNFQVLRFTSEGKTDTTGAGSTINIDFGGKEQAFDLKQIGSAYYLAGTTERVTSSGTETKVAVAKLNLDFALNTSFGTTGLFTFDTKLPGVEYKTMLSGTLNGNLMLSGHTIGASGNRFFNLAVRSKDGIPDGYFGTGGLSINGEKASNPWMTATLVQSNVDTSVYPTEYNTRIVNFGSATVSTLGGSYRKAFANCNRFTLY